MKLCMVWFWCFVGLSGAFAQEQQGLQKSEQQGLQKQNEQQTQKEEPLLSFDERGKYIYYEVVSLKEKTAEELKQRAKAYFKILVAPKIQLSAQDSLWTGKGKFIINKTAFVLTRPAGEVRYQLYLDFKDGKYRFWLTDFSFIPYQRDRYGNFVPATPIGTSLEQKPGKLNAAEWESYLKVTAKEAQLFADKFKRAMLLDEAITVPTAKAVPVQTTKDQKW